MNSCISCDSSNTKAFAPNPIMRLYLEAVSGEDKYIFKSISCTDGREIWTEEYKLTEISHDENLPMAG